MKKLVNDMDARRVLNRFSKSLWGYICCCMAYGFFPKTNEIACKFPGCKKNTNHRGGYCSKYHKELHKAMTNSNNRNGS